MNDSDWELVVKARKGDLTAFEALVEKYKRSVYKIARSRVSRHDDADDLAQEIFLRVFKGIRKFKGASSFKTWMFRIAMNTSINYGSRMGERMKREAELKESVLAGQEPESLVSLIREERETKLRQLIETLPVKQRKTLTLKIDGGLKYSEIAKVMGCSEGTAKANFFHAVRKLREGLRDFVFPERDQNDMQGI